ncbi:hypothetical protein PbJCM13498_06940 [Prolixibacter bellariivorans]|uniref:Lipid A 3-O-deacylase n=1 Tax=Prolixibacter bellariivorans TaxID=314319 RepID=A0A5M4AW77_9BACT|nr:hypothetical protein [Prolixibacter bellariivorans]GET31831.1 hypothetical protein PbJCM13498_06940 [Prolixibacter bellariivorans]
MYRSLTFSVLSLVFVLLFSIESVAQEASTVVDTTGAKKKYKTWIGANYEAGTVFKLNNSFPAGNGFFNYHAADIRLGWQTNGSKVWHGLSNYPYYGIGLTSASFFDDVNQIGQPAALYFFYGGNIKRWKRSGINYEWRMGLSSNFDSNTATTWEQIIGARKNMYMHLGFEYAYQLSQRFDLAAGIGYTHYTNAQLAVDSRGLNMFAPKIELRYHLSDSRPVMVPVQKSKYKGEDELVLSFNAGAKEMEYSRSLAEEYWGKNFFVGTFSAAWLSGMSRTLKAGLGFDMGYDASMKAEMMVDNDVEKPVTVEGSDYFTLGTFGTIEYAMDRISLVGDLGIFLLNKDVPKAEPRFYQRIGVRYHLNNDMFAGVRLRATDFSQAEFVEWSIGYRFRWNRK